MRPLTQGRVEAGAWPLTPSPRAVSRLRKPKAHCGRGRGITGKPIPAGLWASCRPRMDREAGEGSPGSAPPNSACLSSQKPHFSREKPFPGTGS